MFRPTTRSAAAAAAALLALALAGCSSDDAATTESAAATPAASASAMEQGPTESASSTQDATEKGDSGAGAKDDASATATEGAWIDQATYESDRAAYHKAGDVVLFFNASWCPTCKQTVKSLDADGAPAGLTVVSVDYDSSADLKEQYGVTVQHTFVQVDEAGKQQAKFTGSLTGEQIAAKTA